MPWPQKNSVNDADKIYAKPDKVIKVKFLEDEPELYYTHYIGGKVVKCGAPDCQHCLQGDRRSTKGSIRVMDLEDGKEKKLNGSAALFNSIHDAVEMCGSIKSFIFSIKATGEKRDRRYTVMPMPLGAAPAVKTKVEDEEVPF